jgi:hypothetical protein
MIHGREGGHVPCGELRSRASATRPSGSLKQRSPEAPSRSLEALFDGELDENTSSTNTERSGPPDRCTLSEPSALEDVSRRINRGNHWTVQRGLGHLQPPGSCSFRAARTCPLIAWDAATVSVGSTSICRST